MRVCVYTDIEAIGGYNKYNSLLQIDPQKVRTGVYQHYPAYHLNYWWWSPSLWFCQLESIRDCRLAWPSPSCGDRSRANSGCLLANSSSSHHQDEDDHCVKHWLFEEWGSHPLSILPRWREPYLVCMSISNLSLFSYQWSINQSMIECLRNTQTLCVKVPYVINTGKINDDDGDEGRSLARLIPMITLWLWYVEQDSEECDAPSHHQSINQSISNQSINHVLINQLYGLCCVKWFPMMIVCMDWFG